MNKYQQNKSEGTFKEHDNGGGGESDSQHHQLVHYITTNTTDINNSKRCNKCSFTQIRTKLGQKQFEFEETS